MPVQFLDTFALIWFELKMIFLWKSGKYKTSTQTVKDAEFCPRNNIKSNPPTYCKIWTMSGRILLLRNFHQAAQAKANPA